MTSIFRPAVNFQHKRWRWLFIHNVLKYRLINPFLKVLCWFGRDAVIRKHSDIPADPWNNHLRLFDATFDHAVEVWKRHFLRIQSVRGSPKLRTLRQEEQLQMMKRLLLTLCLEDVAYRELFNVLMIELYQQMRGLYPDGSVEHVFYQCEGDGRADYFLAFNGKEVWQP